MSRVEDDWDRSLACVIERLDKADQAVQGLKDCLRSINTRYDQANKRVDETKLRLGSTTKASGQTREYIGKGGYPIDKLIPAIYAYGVALLITAIAFVIVLGWTIVRAG